MNLCVSGTELSFFNWLRFLALLNHLHAMTWTMLMLKLAEVVSLQAESHLSYSRSELGWEICLQRRVYRKGCTLLINNRLSPLPLWHTPSCISYCQAVFWLSHTFMTKNTHTPPIDETREHVKSGTGDVLFILVSWWCKSEMFYWNTLIYAERGCQVSSEASAQ